MGEKKGERIALPAKILLVSIVLIAVLAAMGYYFFSGNKSDSIRPGEVNLLSGKAGKLRPSPEGGLRKRLRRKKLRFRSRTTRPGRIETLPPRRARDSPPPPPVSSEPPSSAKIPQAVPAPAPKETQSATAKEGEKPGEGKEISKKLPAKKAEVPPKKDFFAIKILTLADQKRAQEFMIRQKKKGFDVHRRTVSIKDKGVVNQIFLGHFGSQGEAQRFLNEKKIRQLYPDSVIMKLTR